MELVFVRHAQPAWARGDRPDMDPALTDLGREQARRVAERLAVRGASEVWVSPARRARETADPVARGMKLDHVIVDDLVEMRLPDWSELSLGEVKSQFKRARERPPEAWWDGLPGGETFRDFRVRVEESLDKELARRGVRRVKGGLVPLFQVEADIGRIVVVGHGGTNAVALSVLTGIPSVPWEWERFTLGHASILRMKLVPLGPREDGGSFAFSLRAFNDTEHLPRELRSS